MKSGWFGWLMIVGGVAMVGMVVGGVVYSKSGGSAAGILGAGGSAAGSNHELTGAVKKRQRAFKEAMKIKLGWKRGDSVSSDLRESLA